MADFLYDKQRESSLDDTRHTKANVAEFYVGAGAFDRVPNDDRNDSFSVLAVRVGDVTMPPSKTSYLAVNNDLARSAEGRARRL